MPFRAAPLLCVLLLVAGVPACSGGSVNQANRSNGSNGSNGSNSANPKNRTPSCLPPGYRPPVGCPTPVETRELKGQELDVKLAVVEGEVISRRRLVREAGPRVPGQTEMVYEEALRRRLKERARLLIFVREARRVGVSISQQKLEEITLEQLQKEVREARETTGEMVTVDGYLAEQGLTMDEYRAKWREELMYQAYLLRLIRGLGGPTRPQVDMEVTPAEVRAIYWNNPRAFDEHMGIMAASFSFPVESFLSDDVGFLDAEEMALEKANAVAGAFRSGLDAKEIARRFELPEGEWSVADKFLEEEPVKMVMGEELSGWLFEPTRQKGDAEVLPQPQGPVVFGIVDVRPGRRMSFEEAYPDIVKAVAFVRQKRLEEQRLVEILSTRNVVQPPELASELLDDAQRTLEQLSKHPVYGAMRFR